MLTSHIDKTLLTMTRIGHREMTKGQERNHHLGKTIISTYQLTIRKV
jgi:hypothetical protein